MKSQHHKGEILLVDDQPEQLKVLTRLLNQNGYVVRPALTGRLALQAAKKSPPDLILLDIMLPDIVGFEICRELKQYQPTVHVPVIFMSALNEVENKIEAFDAGGADYITKPFQMAEVLARVEVQLTLSQMQTQLAKNNERLQQEIDQRQQTETALRYSEQRYRTLFSSMLDGYALHEIILDNDGTPIDYRFLDLNPAFEKMTGLGRDIIGKTVLEVIPNTEPYWIETYGQVALTGNPTNFENYSAAVGQKWFNVVTFSPQKGQFATVVQDITRRKQSEIELRKLSRAVEQSATSVVITNNKGIIEYVNPAFIRNSGYTAAEAVGNNPRILKSDYHSPEFYREMWQTIIRGEVWEGEICNRNKNGELFWEWATISPTKSEDGQITHFIAHKENITARRAAQAQMQQLNRQLTQRNATLLALHSIGQTLSATLDVNEIYRVMYREVVQKLLDVPYFTLAAYSPKTKLITCQMSIANGEFNDPSLYPPLPLGSGPISETIRTREPRIVDMVKVRTQLEPLGRVVQLGDDQLTQSGAYVPVISNDQPIGVLYIQDYKENAFTHDTLNLLAIIASQLAVTLENAELFSQLSQERSLLSRRVAEQTAELQVANTELSRAVRVKDEFLANMSHELRTPLNAILGMAEILRDGVYGPINDNQTRSVQLIDESGQHLLSLINDILDLSKIEAGKLDLQYNSVNIADICTTSLRFVKQQAIKSSIKLCCNIAPDLTTIEADERRLKQILVNLLNNAVKFTPQNGTVGLDVGLDPDTEGVSFTVWDTGVGIAPKEFERLFKPFVQADSSLTRHHEGTGLGLSLVFRLTDMHGGCVRLETEEGQGSRFIISIPRQQLLTVYTNLLYPQKNEPFVQTPTAIRETISVLLAEDVEPVADLLKEYLSELGYYVWLAKNGTEAIELTKTLNPDLILMDMQLPVIDGAEAVRHLRSNPKFKVTPIIGMTALCLPDQEQRIRNIGLTTCIKKPIHLLKLAELITAHHPDQTNSRAD